MKYLVQLLPFAILLFSCTAEPQQIAEDVVVTEDQTAWKFPVKEGHINDYANLFSEKEEETLMRIIQKHEESTTNDMTILTTRDFGSYLGIEQYVADLDLVWEVGMPGKDNGILIVLNPDAGEMRVACGLALEKVLSDEVIAQITNEEMYPYFLKNQYFEGMSVGLVAIAELLEATK